MFVKSALVATAFALAAAAAAYQPMLKCSNGLPQCCKAVEDTKNLDHSMMTPESYGWPGPGAPTDLIGFVCMDMPMDGMKCPAGTYTPAVCCEMKKGLLAFGCTPAKSAPVY